MRQEPESGELGRSVSRTLAPEKGVAFKGTLYPGEMGEAENSLGRSGPSSALPFTMALLVFG